MKKTQWTDYDRYIVLTDNAKGDLTVSYESFLKFKEVMEVINTIAFSDKTNYLYQGNIYNRRITITEAKKIINNVQECIWNMFTKKIFLVSNQLGIKI